MPAPAVVGAPRAPTASMCVRLELMVNMPLWCALPSSAHNRLHALVRDVEQVLQPLFQRWSAGDESTTVPYGGGRGGVAAVTPSPGVSTALPGQAVMPAGGLVPLGGIVPPGGLAPIAPPGGGSVPIRKRPAMKTPLYLINSRDSYTYELLAVDETLTHAPSGRQYVKTST